MKELNDEYDLFVKDLESGRVEGPLKFSSESDHRFFGPEKGLRQATSLRWCMS